MTIYEKGTALLNERKYEEVINLISPHLKNNENDYKAICIRSVAYRNTGKLEMSLAEFQKAALIAPTDANVYAETGVTFFHLKRMKDALEMMNRALTLEPDNPYRYSSRAYMRDACKDVDGAIADYKKAIELDPEDAIAHNNLGMLEEKKGRMQNAKNHFAESDKLNNVDWDEFKTRISANYDEPEGNSPENPEAAKKEVQFAQSETERMETPKQSYFSVIKTLFTSKEEQKKFWQFIKNGFK